ncbi:hypothetical protein PCK1_002672 [Pneumocystis canis]|nr:hypothetical protein PCK1_002672 [Pneumocystis canis]
MNDFYQETLEPFKMSLIERFPKQSVEFNVYDDNGGLLMAISGENYVILAGDTRQVRGYTIQSRYQPRIYDMGDNLMVSACGFSGDCNDVIHVLRKRIMFYHNKYHRKLSVQSAARLMHVILYGRRFFPYYSYIVMAGLDKNGQGAIYTFDPVGSYERVSYHAAGGSASLVLPLLDNQIGKKNQYEIVNGCQRPCAPVSMPLDQAIQLIKDAYTSAVERHIQVGDGFQAWILTRDDDDETPPLPLFYPPPYPPPLPKENVTILKKKVTQETNLSCPVSSSFNTRKRDPLSIEELVKKKKEEADMNRPKFLTKEQREAMALERRRLEVEERRQQVEKMNKDAARKYSFKDRGERSSHMKDENGSYGNLSKTIPTEPKAMRKEQDALSKHTAELFKSFTKKQESRVELTPEEKEIEGIRKRYLGTEENKKKKRRTSERKFVFDWDSTEDTSTDVNPIYLNRHSAQFLGRGKLGGFDDKSVKGYAETFINMLANSSNEEDRDRAKQLMDMEYKKNTKISWDDKHWSEKPLELMKERDWRIFKEDFNYTHRIGRTGRAGKSGTAITFLTPEDTDVMYDLKQTISKSSISKVPDWLKMHEAAQRKQDKQPAKKTVDELLFQIPSGRWY